uniref:Uncharacterized protein n=1 Tax=Solanum tuberosum TaxID=4113 RepID=M1DUB8_SOLTU
MFGKLGQSSKRRKGRKASSIQDFPAIFEGFHQGFDPNVIQVTRVINRRSVDPVEFQICLVSLLASGGFPFTF